jgi:hypothetical protein
MRRLCALLALLLCLPSVPTLATVLVPADFREVAVGSQIIVHGRVVDVRSEWVEGNSRIDSFVTVAASAFYRGNPTQTVTFRVPGGQVGRYRAVMVGAPTFTVGEEAVVFLKTDGPAVPNVFGLNQGVFRVRIDSRTGRRLVLPPLLARGPAPERVTRGARTRQPIPLDVFGAQVRTALQQGGAR